MSLGVGDLVRYRRQRGVVLDAWSTGGAQTLSGIPRRDRARVQLRNGTRITCDVRDLRLIERARRDVEPPESELVPWP